MIKPLTISVFQDEVCCSPHWKRSHSRESSWECSARKVVACHTADTILIIVFPLGLVFRQRWVEPSASSYRTRPATSRGRPWWWPGVCTLGCDQTLLIINYYVSVLAVMRESFQRMKAAVRSGGSILFKDNQSAPTSCGPKQVLIDVKAAAINPVDYKESFLFRNIWKHATMRNNWIPPFPSLFNVPNKIVDL